ncbi:OmpL47-type beta-barrel domain-containing protein [Geotalea toluenoxydans]
MGKTVMFLLIFIGMHIPGAAVADTLAGEDAAGASGSSVPALAAPGTTAGGTAPERKKPMSGINVGEPQFISETGLFYVSPATQLVIKVVGGASGIARTEYRIDNGEWKAYEPFRVTAEGSRQIDYRSIDNAGNEESPRSFSIVVDGTPPQTTAFIDRREVVPGRPGLVGKKSTIMLETTEDGSGTALVEYRVDQGAWQPYTSFTAPANGVHTVSYRSVDNVGNKEAEKTITITSEKIPVKTSALVGDPQYKGKDLVISDKTPVTLVVESMSGVISTEFSIDNGPWRKYAPFTVPGAGRHRIAFKSTDETGEKEAPHILDLVVDTTPPETSLLASGQKVERGESLAVDHKVEFQLAADDKMSAVKTTEYQINGGAWVPAVPFSFEAEGKYEIEFRSSDMVGNLEPAGSFTAVIDRTPPVSEIVVGITQSRLDGLVHVDSTTLFQPKATDGLSGVHMVEYSIDGREDTRDTVPFTIITPGRYRIDYQAVDKAGNKEPLKTMLVSVENARGRGEARGDGAAAESAGTPRREFKFAAKAAAAPPQLPAAAPFSDMAGAERRAKSDAAIVDGPMDGIMPESAYSDGYQAPPVNQRLYLDTTRNDKIGLWEYITLGIVNISLILGIMLL